MLVRTWNLFHGNTVPPQREAFLDEMVRRISAGAPDVVCLQELPVWSLPLLDDWSGMVAVGEVAQPPRLGPLPSTAAIGRAITELDHGRFRSAFTGQANAILLRGGFRVLERAAVVLNARDFRREQGRLLGLPLVARLAWARERRVCHAVRARLPDGSTITVANLHATPYVPDQRITDAELLRAAVFLDAVAHPRDVCILAGDFNVSAGRSRTLGEIASWGFTSRSVGIDHVLVRGAEAEAARRLPDDERRLDGALLSDHAAVEVIVDVR